MGDRDRARQRRPAAPAAAGDAQAWDLLVERHTGLLWAIARGHGLSTTDATDAVLTTWSLLAQQLDRIRDPSPPRVRTRRHHRS